MAASYGRIDEIRDGVSPREIYLGFHSHESGASPTGPDSFFDLASLTKILSTTLLAMVRVERGEVLLEDRLSRLLPGYVRENPKAATISLAGLLTHTSGLPAWRPFYQAMRDRFGDALRLVPPSVRRAHFDSLVDVVVPECAPGEKVIYSDLGFLLLERILSKDLLSDANSLFSEVPGLRLQYRPVGAERRDSSEEVLATEVCPWRGFLQGEVHDDNAWSRGGVAGHAGLFGRLRDVQAWMEALFREEWVSMRTLGLFSQTIADSSGVVRARGFDAPARDGTGSTGFAFSRSSIGHLGFTGTSLWMDLDSGDYAILLTNRVHPVRTDDRIRRLRMMFHEEVRR